MNHLIFGVVLGSALVVGTGARPVMAQHGHGDHEQAEHGQTAAVPKCPVMDEPASLALSVDTVDGPVYFCCKGCMAKYRAKPGKYTAKVAAQREALAGRAKVQVICPVSKEPVDRKVSIESDGKKVYFCCKSCAGKYQADPAKYAGALAGSYSYQLKCPVMGGEIDPTASTKLATGETIYYCCQMCDKKLLGNPGKYNENLVAQGIHVSWDEVKEAEAGHGHDHGSHGHDDHDH